MTSTLLRAGSITDHLGPAEQRFFGGGFARVGQRLTDVAIRGDRAGALATFEYPGDWSRKSGGHLAPHVSSVDALVVGVQLAEAFLTHCHGLDAAQRRRMWLRGIELRSGRAPQEELAGVPVEAVRVARGERASRFRCAIGALTVTCEIEHATGAEVAGDARFASIDDLLGPAGERYYGDGYRRRAHRIEGVRPAPDGRSVDAVVTLRPDAVAGQGLGAAYQPDPSMVDAVICLAQLAQVLAYRLDGIDRSSSNTLWVRRLAQQAERPRRRTAGPLPATVWINRAGLIAMGDRRWRTLDVTARLQRITVRSSIAHALPA